MSKIEAAASAPWVARSCRAEPARDRVVMVMEPDTACAAMLGALLCANGFAPRVFPSFHRAWETIHEAPAPHAIIAANDRGVYEGRRPGGLALIDCFRTTRQSAPTRLILLTDDPYIEWAYRDDRAVLTLRKPLIPTVILAFLETDAMVGAVSRAM